MCSVLNGRRGLGPCSEVLFLFWKGINSLRVTGLLLTTIEDPEGEGCLSSSWWFKVSCSGLKTWIKDLSISSWDVMMTTSSEIGAWCIHFSRDCVLVNREPPLNPAWAFSTVTVFCQAWRNRDKLFLWGGPVLPSSLSILPLLIPIRFQTFVVFIGT